MKVRTSAENFSGREANEKKHRKIAKKAVLSLYLLYLYQATIYYICTISVPCVKVQGEGHGPPAPRCRRP